MRLVPWSVVLLDVAIHAQTPPATFELPAPTGNLPVGTTRWVVVDPSRQESFAPGKPREVEVIAWYPRAGSGNVGLAKLGDAYNGLANVQTHSVIDAPPASTPARFPVLVFSHGRPGRAGASDYIYIYI